MLQFLSYKLELNVTFVRSFSHLYGEKEMVKIDQLVREFLTQRLILASQNPSDYLYGSYSVTYPPLLHQPIKPLRMQVCWYSITLDICISAVISFAVFRIKLGSQADSETWSSVTRLFFMQCW